MLPSLLAADRVTRVNRHRISKRLTLLAFLSSLSVSLL